MYISKKSKMIAIILALITFVFGFGMILSKINDDSTMINTKNITVVLDAGHGGLDGGSVGTTTGITEKELNLQFCRKLEKYLRAFGINVVQTRTTLDGLYDENSANLKESDMQKRADIIQKASPQCVVSIHMNKYTDASQRGAQVFYNEENEQSLNLANSIRDELVKNIEYSRPLTLSGDYYMVKCATSPSVIVECGFLSNPQEEKLLQQDEYQNKLSYYIFIGIVRYLSVKID